MIKKMDTVTYELKNGNTVVYVGTTNDPDRRGEEHKNDGKIFTHMNVTSRKMSEAGAMKKEAERLETYKRNQGKTPKYNKTDDG